MTASDASTDVAFLVPPKVNVVLDVLVPVELEAVAAVVGLYVVPVVRVWAPAAAAAFSASSFSLFSMY
jgi:hypothetical protein